MKKYIAVLRKTKDSDYGVDFPDFPGCVSAGKTMNEAFKMAHEALEGHIELMEEKGYPIPKPSAFDEIKNNPEIFETGDAVMMFLVTLQTRKPRAVRLNVTIPENIVEEMDDFARRTGETRSGLLTQAVREYMAGAAKPGVKKAKRSKSRPIGKKRMEA